MMDFTSLIVWAVCLALAAGIAWLIIWLRPWHDDDEEQKDLGLD